MKHFLKERLKSIVFFSILLTGTIASQAYDFEVDGIYYSKHDPYYYPNCVAVVAKDLYSDNSSVYKGEVIIPATVNYDGTQYSVVSVDPGAFKGCSNMTSINLPSTIFYIGSNAFNGCTKLTSIELPSALETIGIGTFYGCRGIKSIDIPDNITEIGDDAFGFSGVNNVKIGNSVSYIGRGAFASSPLQSVEIGSSVNVIGDRAFYDCWLSKVIIPESVTNIGRLAFYANVLSEFKVADTNPNYSSQEGVLFDKDFKTLIQYPSNSVISTYKIPETVSLIEDHAFWRCDNLIYIEISNGVNSIGERNFHGSNIKFLDLPESLSLIGDDCFVSSSLENVICRSTIPPVCDKGTAFGTSNLSQCFLYVPDESVELYQSTAPWSKFKIRALSEYNFEAKLEAENIEISKGQTDFLSININTNHIMPPYSGFQFDVEMPEGLSITDVKLSETLSAAGFTATNSSTEGNPLRVVSYKTNGNGVTTTNGIVTLTIKADANAREGDKTISFTNVILSSPTGSDIHLDDSSVKVTVKGVPVSTINVEYSSGKQGDLYVGESAVYVATVTPDNASDKSVTWSIADTDVASFEVNDTDKSQVTVKALNIGETTLKATANDGSEIEGTVTIKVVATPITSVVIESEDNKTSLYPEETLTLTAKINPETAIALVTYKWESDNTAVATVEGNTATATLTAVTPGEANITVTATNGAGEVKSTAFKVTVASRPITSVTISEGTSVDKKVGEIFTLTAVVNPSNATNPVLAWSSDKPEIVKVEEGTVTPLASGSAVITVTASNAASEESASIIVNVIATPASSITLNKTEATLKTTEELQLTATVLPAETTYKAITWTSSDATTATVDTDGNIKALQPGNVTITATVTDTPSVKATCEITIEELILGDANDDGQVTVSDVVTIVNYLNDLPYDNFCVIAANADQSTEMPTPESPKDPIDQNDIAVTVDMIISQINTRSDIAPYYVAQQVIESDDKIIIDETKISSFSKDVEIKLSDTKEYISLMADFILPEGSVLESISIGEKAANHILSYNVVDGNILKVVLYSLENAILKNSESAILNIRLGNVISDEAVKMGHARVSDSSFRRYSLGFDYANPSSIADLTVPADGIYNVYNLNGVKVMTTTDKNELKQLKKGIYVINGQKVMIHK